MRERNRFVSRFKIRVCHFSLAGLLAITQLNLGTAHADWADEALTSFKSPLDYPLLADVDQENRKHKRERGKKQVQQPKKLYSNEPRRPSQKTGKRYDQRDYKQSDYTDKRREQGKNQAQRPRKFYSNEPRRPSQKTGKRYEHRDYKSHDYTDKRKVWRTKDKKRKHVYPYYPKNYYSYPKGRYPRHHPKRDIVIVRPLYRRHHHHRYYLDDDFWGWMAFTAITLAILDNLNEQQQREHELALYSATRAPLGETIIWSDGTASGSVTPLREGTSSAGRYCREFQHEVTIGGKSEILYGTSCQNPDGSWEIVQ